ncbi:transposase [Streptomyces sp. NPDC018000]|uniref:transposase n=1 Tax=Streptomyces sp. NPDC018000 TaxID=3365028 RepID=UPI003788A01C
MTGPPGRQPTPASPSERHREKWRLALDMIDEVRDNWELPDLPVVADAGYGDATGFREGLTERGLPTRSRSKPPRPRTPATPHPSTRRTPGTAALPRPPTPNHTPPCAPWH